jgi:long-chain fatty acid transport protein
MARPRLALCRRLAGLLFALTCAPAVASSFGIFQHGGQGTAEAGAFTARATEPSAIFYNPAAVAALQGVQVQVGFDVSQGKDSYTSSTGATFAAHHVINIPPHVYVTWKPRQSPLGFGLGIDTPFYYTEDWHQAEFPGRFLNRRLELEIFELHPVMAYDLGGGWSVGAGVRYDWGTLVQGNNIFAFHFTDVGQVAVRDGQFELFREANSHAHAYSWDAAVRYATTAWGWGAVYRDEARLAGEGGATYRALNISATPAVTTAIQQQFNTAGRAGESFLLPRELRAGLWIAPYPELRLELDYAYRKWSSLPDTVIDWRPDVAATSASLNAHNVTVRNWHDTSSLRLGIAGDVGDHWVLHGGLGYEQSPVPGSTREPQFPRGNAYVFAAGFSWNLPWISFDAAISYHRHQGVPAGNQELLGPLGNSGSYKSDDRIAGGSIRWHF